MKECFSFVFVPKSNASACLYYFDHDQRVGDTVDKFCGSYEWFDDHSSIRTHYNIAPDVGFDVECDPLIDAVRICGKMSDTDKSTLLQELKFVDWVGMLLAKQDRKRNEWRKIYEYMIGDEYPRKPKKTTVICLERWKK